MFVSVSGRVDVRLNCHAIMEYYDSDDDFCLTQTPSKAYQDTQSASFGCDIVDNYHGEGNQGLVSLEYSSQSANFDLGYEFSQPTQPVKFAYDNVEIEDISSDDDVDTM